VSPYPIIVTTYDADPRARKIVYVNAAFTGVTGYASAEAVGMPATPAGASEFLISIEMPLPRLDDATHADAATEAASI
jgi:hypothetical protein